MRGPIQEQEIGFFDGVDEVRRRSALVPAGRVGQPPRLGSELNDVLFSLWVDDVVAEAAASNKGGKPGDLATALKKFA